MRDPVMTVVSNFLIFISLIKGSKNVKICSSAYTKKLERNAAA